MGTAIPGPGRSHRGPQSFQELPDGKHGARWDAGLDLKETRLRFRACRDPDFPFLPPFFFFFFGEAKEPRFSQSLRGPLATPGKLLEPLPAGLECPGVGTEGLSPPKSRFHTPLTPFRTPSRIYWPRLSRRSRLLCGILSKTLPAAAAWA